MAPGIMCFGRKPVDSESKRNEEIERQLKADRKKQEREVKLLLLGTAERALIRTNTVANASRCR
jgi:guanine nucleotide-binding protein subunit alpha, other